MMVRDKKFIVWEEMTNLGLGVSLVTDSFFTFSFAVRAEEEKNLFFS
jgi:hypothetical protein